MNIKDLFINRSLKVSSTSRRVLLIIFSGCSLGILLYRIIRSGLDFWLPELLNIMSISEFTTWSELFAGLVTMGITLFAVGEWTLTTPALKTSKDTLDEISEVKSEIKRSTGYRRLDDNYVVMELIKAWKKEKKAEQERLRQEAKRVTRQQLIEEEKAKLGQNKPNGREK